MIKKFIQSLLQRRPVDRTKPRRYSADTLKINPSLLPHYARRVTDKLQQAGYDAFIVGGAVRDLLLGQQPKDFDVATNATPAQVRAIFRRSRIIGRRFQIVHVGFGREVVEVSTFRAQVAPVVVDEDAATEARGKPIAQTRTVDETGRLIRDNVFGEQHEDAARRDFTVNALFYDPAQHIVLDYYNGVADIQAKRLRIIGDPATRYREDPVRMLRAVRFAAKLGFSIDAATRAPIAECADLITGVNESRLFDEVLKLLFCGASYQALKQLRDEGLHSGLLPLLDNVLACADSDRFIQCALANTDARIKADKSVSPGFLFAALLWPQLKKAWDANVVKGEHLMPALFIAADQVLDQQTGNFSIQRRFVADMKEVWALQPRFEKRTSHAPFRFLEHERFRAAYDFLLLRCQAGEMPAALGDWWTRFIDSDSNQREKMISEVAGPKPRRRVPRAKPKTDTEVVNESPTPSAKTSPNQT